MHTQYKQGYQIIQNVFDSVKRYILLTGGNILKFFEEIDLNKDNFISKTEMKIALEKMGHSGLSDNDMDQIYKVLDLTGDGRVSYLELCKQFSEFSNTKAIKDQSHWAYYIFENIRRALNAS